MEILPLIYAPNPVFKKKAALVTQVDDRIRSIIDRMFATMYHENAIGMGANMVGILERIVVVDLNEEDEPQPYAFINPEITETSEELQEFEEASICFPGIRAVIQRPSRIVVRYLDPHGNSQEMQAAGFLATVIQHEIDYLNGIVFLDYCSPMQRNRLMKKMIKYRKQHAI